MNAVKQKNKFKLNLTVQIAPKIARTDLPNCIDFRHWIEATLRIEKLQSSHLHEIKNGFDVTIRLVDRAESATLNAKYRKKNRPTNVLSFHYDLPEKLEFPLCCDLAICLPLVRQEAKREHKTLIQHCAHLTIHGILHILGFKHDSDRNAAEMEKLEDEILQKTFV